MVKQLKIILLILLIAITSTLSCTSSRYSHIEYEQRIDNDLHYYVDYVKELSPDFSKVDSVTFYYKEPVSNGNYTIGFCSYSLLHWKSYVKINRHWWKNASDRERIVLMGHELKHCSCLSNWMHIDREDNIGCRTNYMSPQIPSPFCISLYYSEYIAQIKRGCDDR